MEAATVADAVAIAAQRHGDPRFARILNVSSVLMEDRVLRGSDLEKELTESVEVEVLPSSPALGLSRAPGVANVTSKWLDAGRYSA